MTDGEGHMSPQDKQLHTSSESGSQNSGNSQDVASVQNSSSFQGPNNPHGSNNAQSKELRRAEIVAAARYLYEKKGLSHTSVQDITNHIGVTRTLFYHYFTDKDEVTLAVLDDYVADYLEALQYWNAQRKTGNIEHALDSLLKLVRQGIFQLDPFRRTMASSENAQLYLEFINRIADRTASYIVDTTVQDYGKLHTIRINHIYETFYMLILGVVGYLRTHPDVDDAVLKDVISQTLHMDRGTQTVLLDELGEGGVIQDSKEASQ